jgi:hypothetical protein
MEFASCLRDSAIIKLGLVTLLFILFVFYGWLEYTLHGNKGVGAAAALRFEGNCLWYFYYAVLWKFTYLFLLYGVLLGHLVCEKLFSCAEVLLCAYLYLFELPWT